MSHKHIFSRREFFKRSALALGGLAFSRGKNWRSLVGSNVFQEEEPLAPEFPENVQLGRICAGSPGTHFDIKSEPYLNAPSVGTAWFDDVFEWKQEVVTKQIDPIRINQRWVETPLGYIYAEYVQKSKYLPQQPLEELPVTPQGERGMWVEIVTPYAGMSFVTAPSQYWIREAVKPRIYYSQVFWAFDVRQDPLTGQKQYCLKQLYGALPDEYWVDARVCRQISPEEVEPIHPGADRKKIIVDLQYQTLACFEGEEEVFFTQVTTGGYNYEEEKWLTPIGKHTIWRKMISTHMSSGPAVGNFDISGVAWTTLFDNNGAAIHSTYWHNYFGTPRSHGCVNTRPEDAKWVWRWTEPAVAYYPGELTVQGLNQSTIVEVFEA
ncbi:MAG: L,D-transpeptidase [Anaerolineales bacterium]